MSAHDIPLLIISDNAQTERRISPSWSIATLKAKLEPITGIPVSSQVLTLKVASWPEQPLQPRDEEATPLSAFPLQSYAEIHVQDTRPAAMKENYTDLSGVQKYEMPQEEYESRTDSVLAWKKAQKLGRFDPNAPSIEEQKVAAIEREIEERGIREGARCRLLPESDSRRGTIKYVGAVAEIPGLGSWVGVALDEPTGKNDGSLPSTQDGSARRYFTASKNCGVFVRAERVEVGDFAVLDEFGSDDEF